MPFTEPQKLLTKGPNMNMDIVSFTVTAPGASPGTAMAAVAGDVGIVRNAVRNSLVAALAIWTNGQVTAGQTQILWPSCDLVRGFRYQNGVLLPDNKVPEGYLPRFRPQDPLTVTEIGSAVAGDVETMSMLMWYENLPGVSGRNINLAELRRRGVNMITSQDSSTAAAASVYSGQRTWVQAADNLKADTDYALLGGVVGANTGGLFVRGVDSGNLRVGFPGLSQIANETSNWFIRLSEANDLPCIPVFNSANRGAVLIDQLTNENLTPVPFSLNWVELAPKGA
jgi:hypothetical protein